MSFLDNESYSAALRYYGNADTFQLLGIHTKRELLILEDFFKRFPKSKIFGITHEHQSNLYQILMFEKRNVRPSLQRDIFIIYNDGRLIAHQSFEKKSNIDEGSLGGMLTAIQNFINESFLDQEDEVLDEIKYGKLKILLVHGKDIYIAVICGGDVIPNKFQKDMKRLLTLIEVKYSDVLENWDGNMKDVRDIDELIKF